MKANYKTLSLAPPIAKQEHLNKTSQRKKNFAFLFLPDATD